MSGSYKTILVAPSAYKGTLTATAIAQAVTAGIKCARPDAVVTKAPVADGGDGTVEAVRAAVGVELVAQTGSTSKAVSAADITAIAKSLFTIQ